MPLRVCSIRRMHQNMTSATDARLIDIFEAVWTCGLEIDDQLDEELLCAAARHVTDAHPELDVHIDENATEHDYRLSEAYYSAEDGYREIQHAVYVTHLVAAACDATPTLPPALADHPPHDIYRSVERALSRPDALSATIHGTLTVETLLRGLVNRAASRHSLEPQTPDEHQRLHRFAIESYTIMVVAANQPHGVARR